MGQQEKLSALAEQVRQQLGDKITACDIAIGEITLDVNAADVKDVCQNLRDHQDLQFSQLIDLCGVDYLHYG